MTHGNNKFAPGDEKNGVKIVSRAESKSYTREAFWNCICRCGAEFTQRSGRMRQMDFPGCGRCVTKIGKETSRGYWDPFSEEEKEPSPQQIEHMLTDARKTLHGLGRVIDLLIKRNHLLEQQLHSAEVDAV